MEKKETEEVILISKNNPTEEEDILEVPIAKTSEKKIEKKRPNTALHKLKQKIGLLRGKILQVETTLGERGLNIALTRGGETENFLIAFPEEIWNSFPEESKIMLADNIGHLSSLDLGIMLKIKKIKYNTPLPFFKSFFMELLLKCLLYSGDYDSGKIIEYITRLCNLELSFKSSHSTLGVFPEQLDEKSINTLTFGKESLLSFGLARELGLNPTCVIIYEPDLDVVYKKEHLHTYEIQHKEELIPRFETEFNLHIHKIYNGLGKMRSYVNWDLQETDLGWSNMLTEYLFFLLPFNCFYNAKYLLFGNEHSCDAYYYNKEGFKCHLVYDQSAEWMGQMNTILHTLNKGAIQTTSLVQPIHEIGVCKVLYQRYPELAKYQMSCHADNEFAKNNRWCCACAKCATCFVYMKALGFDPVLVGMKEMFGLEYKDYFVIFGQKKKLGIYSNELGRDEQLLAFQLAAKRGAQGELIELFKKEFGEEAAAREEELKNEFFKVHRPENIPPALWKKLKPIFEEELKK